MKITRKLVFLPLLVFLFPVVSMGETVDRKELVVRDNLYYKKFTDVPFTGTVTGEEQGESVEGKKVGIWLRFFGSGQLYSRSNYSKPNVFHGEYSLYNSNGCLWVKGNYVDGEKDGRWVHFSEHCELRTEGKYDNGKPVGESVWYWSGEIIRVKGRYNQKGNREGLWFVNNRDGERVGEVVYDDGEVVSKKGDVINMVGWN